MGSPLKSTTFYSFIDVVFQLQLNNFKKNSSKIYHKDLLKTINHPLFTKFIDPDKILEFRKVIIEQNKIHITVNEIKSFFGVSFENVSVFFNEWTEKEDTLHMLEYLINYFRNNLVITKDSIESEILLCF